MADFLPFVLLALLLVIAVFAASEAALAATNRVRLRHLLRSQGEDSSGAAFTSELSSDAQSFLATVTIAANLPLLVAAGLTLYLARARYQLDSPSTLAATMVVALVTVMFFQVVPRLVVSAPGALERLWWLRPARLVVAVLSPFVGLLLAVGRLVLKPLGLLGTPTTTAASGEGLRELVESVDSDSDLSESRQLIESIFTFGDTRVHEVMAPRPDIVSLPVDCTALEAMTLFEETGLSRVPLRENSIDEVAGILHVKDVLMRLRDGDTQFAPRDILREALYVPESQKIDVALSSMRNQKTHLALVMDEFGGVAGLLTVEDILEELVGEIADEHDRHEDALLILDSNTAIADARLHAADLEEQWGLALPVDEYDTIGGIVIENLGREPRVGDRIELPEAILTVHSTRGKRPHKIHIFRREKRDEGENVANEENV